MIHLATEDRVDRYRPSALMQTNLAGTATLLGAGRALFDLGITRMRHCQDGLARNHSRITRKVVP